MKFVSKTPREGINVSDEHPLIEAGTLIIGLSAIFAVIAIASFFIIDVALMFISTEREARIFSSWIPDDLVAVGADDVRLADTRGLLKRLVQHWSDSPYTFRIEASKSEIPNAMAFPGGLIVVTTGLLDRVETENELAFVLGHELGHFRNRDHIRQLGRGLVLVMLVEALSSNKAGSGLGFGIADLTIRGFSRRQETSADGFGLEILHAEYGHIGEAWRFFERLESENQGDFIMLKYYSTHPVAGDRIENLKNHAIERGWALEGPTIPLQW